MRLDEARKGLIKMLDEASIPLPQLEADILLCHVTGWDRTERILHPEREVDDEVSVRLIDLCRRRCAHEPMAYITGEKEFHGLTFTVTHDTLVPRPDSETLVDEAIDRIKRREGVRILDICTGTGCIGISVANEVDVAQLVLGDISKAALDVARLNAQSLLPDVDTSFILSDLFEDIEGCFDLITANPPYIRLDEEPSLQAEVLTEPRSALFDEDPDGLGIIRRIVEGAKDHLIPGGVLAIECGYGQSRALSRIMRHHGYDQIRIQCDLGGIERTVSGARACHA